MRKKCQKCNLEFECDESATCWCFKEPGIRKEDIQFNNCVCKKCLQEQYKERLLGI